jgi:hypothetical protein
VSRPRARTSQEVEVRFSASSEGTFVELEHRSWERLVATADEISEHYDSGWDEVLARYVATTAARERS